MSDNAWPVLHPRNFLAAGYGYNSSILTVISDRLGGKEMPNNNTAIPPPRHAVQTQPQQYPALARGSRVGFFNI